MLTESSYPWLSILKLQALSGEYDSAGREWMPPQSREMDFVSSGGVREFSIMQAAAESHYAESGFCCSLSGNSVWLREVRMEAKSTQDKWWWFSIIST